MKMIKFLLLLVLIAPALALAQTAASGDVSTLIGAISGVYPQAAGIFVMVQIVAKLISPLPGRIGGFTHSTIWSRFWDTVAAFPAAPAPRPDPVMVQANESGATPRPTG